jgi:hypothetical protein
MLSLIQSMHRIPLQTKAIDQPFSQHSYRAIPGGSIAALAVTENG